MYCLSSNVAVTNGTFLLDLHNLHVSLKAGKKEDKELQMQLETALLQYQAKELRCLKLEQELYGMEKRMAVAMDELKQCMIASLIIHT